MYKGGSGQETVAVMVLRFERLPAPHKQAVGNMSSYWTLELRVQIRIVTTGL
jgi:hypothetical protein